MNGIAVQPDTIEDWQAAVLCCYTAARMLGQWDFGAMIELYDRCDAAGPIIAPELWRERHEAAADDREIVEAARDFVETLKRLECRRRNR